MVVNHLMVLVSLVVLVVVAVVSVPRLHQEQLVLAVVCLEKGSLAVLAVSLMALVMGVGVVLAVLV
jgi:hypothetical protein